MAWKCEVCGKSTTTGNSVSHSNVKTRRTWKPNLQTVRVVGEDGMRKKIKVCAKCLKAGKVKRAV
ncbi:MAG TPA: 50S ribosomal protein L28 [Thermotogota bacterium]|nr:50S ribosomal protein L28 [Thermotogota bacterium]HPJ89109.1 50S ribosomal protein L28 [Thermotogota bacterium]HPR96136.1 50S ribosomal protein L28 [Thermotogota bacterium]